MHTHDPRIPRPGAFCLVVDNDQASLSTPSEASTARADGSHDGTSAGDHDAAYAGFRAYQFGTRQLARLLQLRGELLEARLGHGRWAEDLAAG